MEMEVDLSHLTELVERAQLGERADMSALAKLVAPRVRAYIYRVTLDADLTDDLVQESLLEMVRSLEKLRRSDSFLPWLYRVTHSKIAQHYRLKQSGKAVQLSALGEDAICDVADRADHVDGLIRNELSQKVLAAMSQLKLQYRSILSLRCLEQLSYSDIATTLNCSELYARVQFFRAKASLTRELSRGGLNKGMLLTALGLFGKLTTGGREAAAAVVINSGVAKVGFLGTVVGLASTKLAIISAVAMAAIITSLASVNYIHQQRIPQKSQLKSAHFTLQYPAYGAGATSNTSRGAYESWYYWPESFDGPLFMRRQRWDSHQTVRQCSWLSNEQGTYYYNSGENVVYQTSARLWLPSMKVWRLPSDTPELLAFLDRCDGGYAGLDHSWDNRSGLPTTAQDRRFPQVGLFSSSYEYNKLDENFFRYRWPSDTGYIDQRDDMHRQDWAYFTVRGHIGDDQIVGRGRIPFVYVACDAQPPEMELFIGDDLRLIDTASGALVSDGAGQAIMRYPSGSFLAGLPRPWSGLHAIDIIRRDAAMQQIVFQMQLSEDYTRGSVVLSRQAEADTLTVLKYAIDMDNDLIDRIDFAVRSPRGREITGVMEFDFGEWFTSDPIFVESSVSPESAKLQLQEPPGISWLLRMAEGKLGI